MSDVINLNKYKEKLVLEKELAQGRNPLYLSHSRGKISDDPDFNERIVRIRSSLKNINRLMSELKTLSKEGDQ